MALIFKISDFHLAGLFLVNCSTFIYDIYGFRSHTHKFIKLDLNISMH